MRPHKWNALNAVVLILMGAWAYFGSESPSPTALIPVGFGVLLLALTPQLRKENKIVAHTAVVLTLIIFIALFRPLLSAIDGGETLSTVRVSAMLLTSLLALISFIRSFIQARKNRAN